MAASRVIMTTGGEEGSAGNTAAMLIKDAEVEARQEAAAMLGTDGTNPPGASQERQRRESRASTD